MRMRVTSYGAQRMPKNNRANDGKLRRNETKRVKIHSYSCIMKQMLTILWVKCHHREIFELTD